MTTETDAADAVADDATLDEAQDIIDQANPTSADDAGADAEGEQGQGEQTQPKRQTAQERIDELTRARRDAEREAEFWKSKAIPAKEEQAPNQQADEDPEPDPDDSDRYPFGETDKQFLRDYPAWAARQEFARLQAAAAQQTAVRTVQEADAARRAEFTKTHPDFQAKVLETNWGCTAAMGDAIQSSEHGPAIAYELANNPTEARRIAALDTLAQIRAIGAIEGRLSAAATNTTTKTVSDAPAPAPNVRGAGGKFKAAPDTGDFAAFDAAYGNG